MPLGYIEITIQIHYFENKYQAEYFARAFLKFTSIFSDSRELIFVLSIRSFGYKKVIILSFSNFFLIRELSPVEVFSVPFGRYIRENLLKL